MVKSVPPSNPRDNTAVQQRFQRSANRFSASGEKTIFVHFDYESQFNVPQNRPQKERETLPSLILDPRYSYQPSKPIDKPNPERPSRNGNPIRSRSKNRGSNLQSTDQSQNLKKYYQYYDNLTKGGYNLKSPKSAQHDKDLNDELLEIQALTKELYESIQQMPTRGSSVNNSSQYKTLAPLDKKEGYFDDKCYMIRGTMTKRAKVDPIITLENIIKRSGPSMPTEIRNDTSSELNFLRKDQNKPITLPTRNFIDSFFLN